MTNIDFDAGLRSPGHAQSARIPQDPGRMSHVTPRFYEEMVKTDQISPETGLPVFRSIEYVELLIAGDKGNSPTKRVNDAIRQQFPNEYARWKATKVNADMIGDGIPLSLWPLIPKEVAKGLEYMNVFTVQQLAGLTDQQISKPGSIGLRDFREKAKSFIESAKNTAPLAKVEAEMSDLRKRHELLQEQFSKLLERAEDAERQLAQGGSVAPRETMPEMRTPRGNQKG